MDRINLSANPGEADRGLLPGTDFASLLADAALEASPAPTDAQQRAAEDQAFQSLMIQREGRRNTVYLDNRGNPTVGIGHLVTPADHLRLGQRISDARLQHLWERDSAAALDAARTQATAAGVASNAFIPALAAVNFQLGTNWRQQFPGTWAEIARGNYATAADMLNGTLWQRQTPLRVQDFQNALRALPARSH